MKSFQTELENPVVEKDIIELEQKIYAFQQGTLPSDKFRSLRLARGIYGQRQQGVQMIRIKLPLGRITTTQLRHIAALSDEYATGNLHLTTRQDIQLHFVSLEKTPELWAKLEQEQITLREACGNTVRNVTASVEAGIDRAELFDVSPYAYAVFQYFLRKPFCQELGRKIKIAFSHTEQDNAFSYIHDLGFIPKYIDNQRGFKVLVGGGLGAQPFLAQVAYEFLPENQLIPFIEATLRVFDRYGERMNRHKARLKFLLQQWGLATFLEHIETERLALNHTTFEVDTDVLPNLISEKLVLYPQPVFTSSEQLTYYAWLQTNTFAQKQVGYHGVYVNIRLGNLSSELARQLADIIEAHAAQDFRISIQQSILLRFVPTEALPSLYQALQKIGLAAIGALSAADVTSCPGTDTCNLAIANSTHIATVLENVIREQFPSFLVRKDVHLKLSGCMNSCGQHGLAQIGFHGSSFKTPQGVVPALQLVMGGTTLGDGLAKLSEKVIKIPSKRAPQALAVLLQDIESSGENFDAYYLKQGKNYFYNLLKPFAVVENLTAEEFIDWGKQELFSTDIGVGECAVVQIDLVATLVLEAEEKLAQADDALLEQRWGDAIYHGYSASISAAKALLIEKEIDINTHHKLIADFETHFVLSGEFVFREGFKAWILSIHDNPPEELFALRYITQAYSFIKQVNDFKQYSFFQS